MTVKDVQDLEAKEVEGEEAEEEEDDGAVTQIEDPDEELARMRSNLHNEESGDDADDPDDTEEEEGEKEQGGFRARGVNPTRASSAKELLLDAVSPRLKSGLERLRPHLNGTILLKVRGGDRYLFDGLAPEPALKVSQQENADCVIDVGEPDLLRIARGSLNPQVAMLTDRMKIVGRAELAVYFFNLVGPR
jgi:hypothetical protein